MTASEVVQLPFAGLRAVPGSPPPSHTPALTISLPYTKTLTLKEALSILTQTEQSLLPNPTANLRRRLAIFKERRDQALLTHSGIALVMISQSFGRLLRVMFEGVPPQGRIDLHLDPARMHLPAYVEKVWREVEDTRLFWHCHPIIPQMYHEYLKSKSQRLAFKVLLQNLCPASSASQPGSLLPAKWTIWKSESASSCAQRCCLAFRRWIEKKYCRFA
jgi:hypothetical protein